MRRAVFYNSGWLHVTCERWLFAGAQPVAEDELTKLKRE